MNNTEERPKGKAWFANGVPHREDGPAFVYEDGTEEYWLNGVEYSEEEFNALMAIK